LVVQEREPRYWEKMTPIKKSAKAKSNNQCGLLLLQQDIGKNAYQKNV
jgi:hypothetical protein